MKMCTECKENVALKVNTGLCIVCDRSRDKEESRSGPKPKPYINEISQEKRFGIDYLTD